MSVRPITQSEELKAYGAPWKQLGGIFFGLQGLVTYIHWNKVHVGVNMIPNTRAFMQLLLLTGGGYAAGSLLGYVFFGDRDLMRLYKTHWVDQRLKVFDDLRFEK